MINFLQNDSWLSSHLQTHQVVKVFGESESASPKNVFLSERHCLNYSFSEDDNQKNGEILACHYNRERGDVIYVEAPKEEPVDESLRETLHLPKEAIIRGWDLKEPYQQLDYLQAVVQPAFKTIVEWNKEINSRNFLEASELLTPIFHKYTAPNESQGVFPRIEMDSRTYSYACECLKESCFRYIIDIIFGSLEARQDSLIEALEEHADGGTAWFKGGLNHYVIKKNPAFSRYDYLVNKLYDKLMGEEGRHVILKPIKCH